MTATAKPSSLVAGKVPYPAGEIGKLLAPPETENPAAKLRRLLHEARDKGSYLHSAGAYDAYTAAIMTRLGFKALYGSGWQLAATWNMYPDIGVYHSHQMAELTLMLRKGIEGARHTSWYDSDGKELLEMPPIFVDMEAGFGGPGQTFTLASELIRVGAAGVHLENQDPSDRTCGHIVNVGKAKRDKVLVPRKAWIAKLKAIKAASDASGWPLVSIARTDSVDGAIPGQPQGGIQRPTIDQGEKVVLVVRSDSGEAVHLHGYNLEKDIVPGKPIRLPFTANIAGRFELELHPTDTLLSVIEVKP